MALLNAMSGVTNAISAGGSVLNLAGVTAALVTGDDFPPGIAGFVFDIPLNVHVALTAQITDHWAETNSAIQDHVALEPIRVELTGLIGEMVYTKTEAEKYIQTVLQTLQPLGVLSPAMSVSAQQYLAEANRVKQAAESALGKFNDLASILTTGSKSDNKQQIAYQTLDAMWRNRSIVTVETPWATYTSMVIESVSFDQDEQTKDVSTVRVALKEFRTVSVTAGIGKLLGRTMSQAAPVSDKGTSKGKDTSFAKGLLNLARGQ